jgi:hypothetical protein
VTGNNWSAGDLHRRDPGTEAGLLVPRPIDTPWASMASMSADAVTLAQLLTYAALLGATCEYAEIMKRRQVGRVMMAERAEIEQSGLEGLVRVFLTEDGAHPRRDRRMRRLFRRPRRG